MERIFISSIVKICLNFEFHLATWYDSAIEFKVNRKRDKFMWGYLHLISWAAIIILTLAAWISYPKSEKGFTIFAMIDRVFYLVLILSGIMMIQYSIETNWLVALFKILMGIVTIGVIEMLLSFRKKKRPTGLFLVLFVVAVVITIALGFYLSGGAPLF